MNTANQEIQQPGAGRRHARYSDEFRRQVVAACQAPGVSKAAIALANGLNANMLRRWVVESTMGRGGQLGAIKKPLLPAQLKPDFIPVQLTSAPAVRAPDIRIELQHAGTAIQIHWPMAASSQCAQWLREVLA
jgi:transposase-like protein